MQQILPLRGVIQHYDWGSRTALAELLGRPSPSERPEAELWLGAHPNGSAEVRVEGRWERLDALIARDGGSLLGPASIAAFGRRLPFLFKILAVERPLSLQVHPDAEQARVGFAREPAKGPSRLYADPFGKPELICAVTPFTALCGLRPLAEVRADLAALGLDAWISNGSADLPGLLRSWLTAPRECLRGAVEAAGRVADENPVCAAVVTLAAQHPDDPGALAPVFLHRLELAPGEALFLPPGELHCYLAGVAVELMANSDNVLRGGLTAKPVDVDELLRIARLASRRPPILHARPCLEGASRWQTPASEFELSSLRLDSEQSLLVAARSGVEILWCLEGALCFSNGSEGLKLGRGESCLVPASVGAYRIAGQGWALRARLPT